MDYNVELVGAADEILPVKLSTVKWILPLYACNLASVLYNKNRGRCKNVNTLGVLYMLETNGGESIQSVADLAGKTIVTTGQELRLNIFSTIFYRLTV